MNDYYAMTMPLFIRTLRGLREVLGKAAADVAAGKLEEKKLLDDRLAPDMFPLKKQVQVASDQAKGAAARLTGQEPPKFEDAEATIAELQVRIDKTLQYLQSLEPQAFRDAATRRITLPYFPGKYFEAADYVSEYALPNFFFHAATAYGLVRKNGVAIGKADYIHELSLKDL